MFESLPKMLYMCICRSHDPQAGAAHSAVLYSHGHPQCSMPVADLCMQNTTFSRAHLGAVAACHALRDGVK